MINAIDLAFAPRVPKDVIKTGAEKAVIELVIENKNHDMSWFYEQNGIDNLGDEIIITKEITPSGARSRINGTLASSEILKSLKSIFIDIHSQHQTYSFMQPKYHITLLDSYGKDSYGLKLAQYKSMFTDYKNLISELEKAQNSQNTTESELEFLKFQINEINSAAIKSETEDEELTRELEVLENAEKLKELTGASYWALNGDENSILEGLNKIKSNIAKASGYDPSLEELERNIIEASETLKEAGSELNRYSRELENDTGRLDEIQERLFLLDKLKRKYGGTLEAVFKTYENLTTELSAIEISSDNIEDLQEKIAKAEEELKSLGAVISRHRKDFAKVLSVQIQDKLELLELPKSQFEIAIRPKELSADGIDDVEFLISTNISEDLKPLAKTASGGEISRVMLAIKTIFAENDDIDTVIFDEIDTGISGRAAQSVADEILALSKYRQIILITHQAIIASKSDKHFYVKKSQTDQTKVEVYVLTGENKIKALAELAAGGINEQSMDFARSLVENY